MRNPKHTKEFEEFCDEVCHAVCLSHDKLAKKNSCGYCGTEDCTCAGHGEECDCNFCQAVYEVETKQKGFYLSYSHVFESFMEFPQFGFVLNEYNTATDWEEFAEQVQIHMLFLRETHRIFKRHIKSRIECK